MDKSNGIVRFDSLQTSKNQGTEKWFEPLRWVLATDRQAVGLTMESACLNQSKALLWMGLMLVSVIWLVVVACIFFAFLSDEDWSALMEKRQCAIPGMVVNGTVPDLTAEPINRMLSSAR